MTSLAVAVKARKGDLVLIERSESSYVVGQGRTERVTFSYGVVHSATRDGAVKKWAAVSYGDQLVSEYGATLNRGERVRVVPKVDIDVMAVLRAAKAHHWPGHPGQPMPFDSLADAVAVAKPHRITS